MHFILLIANSSWLFYHRVTQSIKVMKIDDFIHFLKFSRVITKTPFSSADRWFSVVLFKSRYDFNNKMLTFVFYIMM
jgi:hypothetical protein